MVSSADEFIHYARSHLPELDLESSSRFPTLFNHSHIPWQQQPERLSPHHSSGLARPSSLRRFSSSPSAANGRMPPPLQLRVLRGPSSLRRCIQSTRFNKQNCWQADSESGRPGPVHAGGTVVTLQLEACPRLSALSTGLKSLMIILEDKDYVYVHIHIHVYIHLSFVPEPWRNETRTLCGTSSAEKRAG